MKFKLSSLLFCCYFLFTLPNSAYSCNISCWTKDCYTGCSDASYGEQVVCTTNTVLQFYTTQIANREEKSAALIAAPQNDTSSKPSDSRMHATTKPICKFQCINIQIPDNLDRYVRGCIPSNSSVMIDLSLKLFHSALKEMDAVYQECTTSLCNIVRTNNSDVLQTQVRTSAGFQPLPEMLIVAMTLIVVTIAMFS